MFLVLEYIFSLNNYYFFLNTNGFLDIKKSEDHLHNCIIEKNTVFVAVFGFHIAFTELQK